MYGKLKPTERYNDIIALPHHVSGTRPRMAMIDRAAQFAPFAALTGYDAAIRETGRLTEERIEIDESRKEALNEKLQLLLERLAEHPDVAITYFKPDDKKDGGAYVCAAGRVRKIDTFERVITLEDMPPISIEQIYEIDGELFNDPCLAEYSPHQWKDNFDTPPGY